MHNHDDDSHNFRIHGRNLNSMGGHECAHVMLGWAWVMYVWAWVKFTRKMSGSAAG